MIYLLCLASFLEGYMEYILNLVVLKLALMYYLNKLGQGKKDEKSKFINSFGVLICSIRLC